MRFWLMLLKRLLSCCQKCWNKQILVSILGNNAKNNIQRSYCKIGHLNNLHVHSSLGALLYSFPPQFCYSQSRFLLHNHTNINRQNIENYLYWEASFTKFMYMQLYGGAGAMLFFTLFVTQISQQIFDGIIQNLIQKILNLRYYLYLIFVCM